MPEERRPSPAHSESSDAAQREVRLQKIAALRAKGINPYPERFQSNAKAGQIKDKADGLGGVLIAGRLMALREMGRLSFGRLMDRSGVVQIALKETSLGKEDYKYFLKLLDLGDLVGIEGEVFTTKTGEKTIDVKKIILLGKSLRPLPEKWHGLVDQEARYRKRYLDLLTNEASRRVFQLRTKTITAFREFLDQADFEEVETPIMVPTASGAMAKPFLTHHHALDIDLSLRIAPETYLKRLIVGGYERVYEIAKCFRNEGMDPSHLQEFSQIEYYAAYWNFNDNMDFTEKLLLNVLDKVLGTRKITYAGQEIDFLPPWPRRSFADAFKEEAEIDMFALKSIDDVVRIANERSVELEMEKNTSLPNAIDALYKKLVRPKLIQPQFIISHPADLKPLARRNDDNHEMADSFQLLVNGWEVINAYSELVDPIVQRQAFEVQSAARDAGDEEAMAVEEDYLEAMEYGMPPISGWGMGIDRFIALIADQPNLRDTVFFPTMRPEGSEE